MSDLYLGNRWHISSSILSLAWYICFLPKAYQCMFLSLGKEVIFIITNFSLLERSRGWARNIKIWLMQFRILITKKANFIICLKPFLFKVFFFLSYFLPPWYLPCSPNTYPISWHKKIIYFYMTFVCFGSDIFFYLIPSLPPTPFMKVTISFVSLAEVVGVGWGLGWEYLFVCCFVNEGIWVRRECFSQNL